ncbi:MAG: penicillin acylase family protein [Acidobacteriota bacterium]
MSDCTFVRLGRLTLCLVLLPHVITGLVFHSPAHPQRIPAPTATTTLAGLTASVTVTRDARSIPYITAKNELDLVFAQGFITASDRLWQMDLLRRTGAGELAEIFGPQALDEDRLHRTYGFRQVCEATFTQMEADERAYLEAYASGVNAYLAQCNEQQLPRECRLLRYRPRPWHPTDTLLIGKVFAESLSTTWPIDLAAAAMAQSNPKAYAQLMQSPPHVPEVIVVGNDQPAPVSPSKKHAGVGITSCLSPDLLDKAERWLQAQHRALARVGLYAEELAASNNWVISGQRTTTGKPILANDPHLDASAPGIWYMVYLATPAYRVAGVTAPGIPGVLIGHNEHIAWGCTNLDPDVQDLFYETFHRTRPHLYQTPQGWQEAVVRVETIPVRRRLDAPDVEMVSHEVTVTRHGPVLLEGRGQRLALRWTALDVTPNETRCYRRLGRAKNWAEFCQAIADYGGATQNFVYADVEGNIGYYGAGRIPRRKSGNGQFPVQGNTDAGEWIGLIPFNELPHVFNPPSEIIVTANNRVVGHSYHHFLTTRWAPPYRARRIYDLLTAQPKVSVADCLRIQDDIMALGALDFVKLVLDIAAKDQAARQDAEWQTTLRLLRDWDGAMTAESQAAVLAVALANAVRKQLLTAKFGTPAADLKLRSRQLTSRDWRGAIFGGPELAYLLALQPTNWLPKGTATYGQLLRACHQIACQQLAERLGAHRANWTWGRWKPVTFPHPLAAVPLFGRQFQLPSFPQRGGGYFIVATPNVGEAVSMRFVADLSQWDASRMGIPLGQSGDPSSPHWADQLESWKACTPDVFPFSPTAVEKFTQQRLTLHPRASAP